MQAEKFYSLIQKTFSLMSEDKLREDMDDTLLEKLLSVIKTGISPCDLQVNNFEFIQELISKTKALQLIDSTMSILTKRERKHASVQGFVLRFLGCIFENEELFFRYKDCIGVKLIEVYRSNIVVSCMPTVQDALLFVLFSALNHFKGFFWIIEHDLIESVFPCLSSTSYYVRRRAISLYAEVIRRWLPNSNELNLSDQDKEIIYSACELTILKIYATINFSSKTDDSHYIDSCILILDKVVKEAVDIDKVLKLDELVERLECYFRGVKPEDEIEDIYINLLIDIYRKKRNLSDTIARVIGSLVTSGNFSHVLYIMAEFLRATEGNRRLEYSHIRIFLYPIEISHIHKKETDECEIDTLFENELKPYFSLLKKDMLKNPSNFPKFIDIALSQLTKLVPILSNTACLEVLLKLSKFTNNIHRRTVNYQPYIHIGNKRVFLSLLEIFSSLASEEVLGSVLDDTFLVELLHNLLKVALNIVLDTNVRSDALKLLKKVLKTKGKSGRKELSPEIRQYIAESLPHFLCSTRETIVDDALNLTREIFADSGCNEWEEYVLNHGIHKIVLKMARHGTIEGFVKASAVRVITDASLKDCYWSSIKEEGTNEVDFMEFLCTCARDTDFFIQREALKCLCKWLRSNVDILPSSYKNTVFEILTKSVSSLDLDLKLSALDLWSSFLFQDNYFQISLKTDLGSFLKEVCKHGLGLSLVKAVDDYDQAIQYKAAEMLLLIRNKFTMLGCSLSDFIIDDDEITKNGNESPIVESIRPMSIEKREECLDNVLNISTSEHLKRLCRNSKSCELTESVKSDNVECSVALFWALVWSDKVDSILESESGFRGAFSDYSISVMEDIVAAEISLEFVGVEDTLDCY